MTKTWSFISFVHEMYLIFSGNLKFDFFAILFCLVSFFFIYSFISDVFFSWITCCASACINLRLEFSLYQRFFDNLPTLLHVPTTSKASLFMLASEHPSCSRGPWRIVRPFLRDFDNHFLWSRGSSSFARDLSVMSNYYLIKIKFWSREKEAYKDKNITTWLYRRSRTLYQTDLFAARAS